MLTGKCKESFKKWYRETDFKSETQPMYFWFKRLPFSMQYGIYVDFFDEKEIEIIVEPYFDFQKDLLYKVCISKYRDINEQNSYTKREYARESALKLANTIYNDRDNN